MLDAPLRITSPHDQVSIFSFGCMKATGMPCFFRLTYELFQVIAATTSPLARLCSTEVMSLV